MKGHRDTENHFHRKSQSGAPALTSKSFRAQCGTTRAQRRPAAAGELLLYGEFQKEYDASQTSRQGRQRAAEQVLTKEHSNRCRTKLTDLRIGMEPPTPPRRIGRAEATSHADTWAQTPGRQGRRSSAGPDQEPHVETPDAHELDQQGQERFSL